MSSELESIGPAGCPPFEDRPCMKCGGHTPDSIMAGYTEDRFHSPGDVLCERCLQEAAGIDFREMQGTSRSYENEAGEHSTDEEPSR